MGAGGRGLFGPLVGLFLDRVFKSGHAATDTAVRHKLSGTLAALSTVMPPVFAYYLTIYVLVGGRSEDVWRLSTNYFGLLMIAAGLLCVAAWDALLPDEVDQAVLASLPLDRRLLIWAKAAAVGLFAGLCALLLCALTPLVFAGCASMDHDSPLSFLKLAGGYYGASLLTCLFTFFACATLRGLPLLLPTWRAAHLASGGIQSALAFACIGGFALLPSIANTLPEPGSGAPTALYFMPPAWSVGFVQVASGQDDPFFVRLAEEALIAPAAAAAAFVVVLSVGFMRYDRLRADTGAGRGGAGRRRIGDLLNATVLRRPQARAAFWFFAQTLWRGPGQRLRLLAFVGGAAGWVFLVETAGGGGLRNAAATLGFLGVVGVRSAASTVLQARASWVVSMTETARKGAYLSGLRWAVWLVVLAPLFLALGLVQAALGPPQNLLPHLLFNDLAACLLAEGLVLLPRRFPFCSHPAPARAHDVPLFIVGFGAYVKALGLAEEHLLTSAPSYLWACLFLASVLTAVCLIRRSAAFGFQYRESGDLLAFSIAGTEEE